MREPVIVGLGRAAGASGPHHDPERLARELAALLAQLMDRAAPAVLASATGRGLGILEIRLLVALRVAAAPVDARSLAAEVGVDPELVDRAVSRLSARGLIVVDVAGRRGAALAPAGRVVLAEVDRSVVLRLRDFVGGLDRGQRLRLEGALHLMGGGL